jgi:hypothetical protein
MDDLSIAVRVAARHQRTLLAGRGWEGKIIGNGWRLQWSDAQWKLEELPAKGKRKLRVAEMQNPYAIAHVSPLIPANILRAAKLSNGDSFDHVKQKIHDGMMSELDDALSGTAFQDHDREYVQKNDSWLRRTQWYEKQVYFTEIMPEGMEPFDAEGADFSIHVEWTSFKAYSPDSDFQQSDPHYTLYEASSPAAARKLYQTLKEDPNAIKHVPWAKFSDWLNSNKIGYKTHFSQWH